MALFTASQFAGVSYDLPDGGGTPANVNDAVTLQLSDGNNVTVCDTLGTALKLLTYMRTNSQWQVLASDDVTVVSINAGWSWRTQSWTRSSSRSSSPPRLGTR